MYLQNPANTPPAKAATPRFSAKTERALTKMTLLCLIQNFLQEMNHFSYIDTKIRTHTMDGQIIQLLIQAIIDSGDYTLEGIAYHTQTPLDILMDAATGISCDISIHTWIRITALFLNARPDIGNIVINRLLHSLQKGKAAFEYLLIEQ